MGYFLAAPCKYHTHTQLEVHRLSADVDNRPIILFIVEFYFIPIVIISLHYYKFMNL